MAHYIFRPQDLTRLGGEPAVLFVKDAALLPKPVDRDGPDGFVTSLDAAEIATGTQLVEAVARSLRVPNPADNLSALKEYLEGRSWIDGRGFVLCVFAAEAVWHRAPRDVGQLIETWLTVAPEVNAAGKPLRLVFVWGPPTWR